MPRRNGRARVEALPLGDEYTFTLDPEEAERRRQRRKERADSARERINMSMSNYWTRCVVPGCHFQVRRVLDGEIEFPVCTPHAVAVWMDIEKHSNDPSIREATAALRARRQVIRQEWLDQEERAEREHQARFAAGVAPGDIYFVRANGLVKVGWSSDVESRLRAYGPNIEIMCVYAGTRQDETTLHRQLQPSRAKGREWYHDDAIIQAFVAEAVAKHGKPRIKVVWTGPRKVVAGKRATRP